MKKVLLNRKPILDSAWGGGNNFVKAFYEFAPQYDIQIVKSFYEKPDVLFMIDPRRDHDNQLSQQELIAYKNFSGCKLIYRVNECDARKGTKDIDQLLNKVSENCDHTVFVSNWIKNYHESKNWGCSNNSVIYNGVDQSIYKENQKLNNEKINIVTHHWSDNKFKGEQCHEWLDQFVGTYKDHFTYTYIGRSQYQFKNSNHIQPLYGKELGEELGKYDVYISATYSDPGPNHIIESIACNIPTYAFNFGGGAAEFVGNDHLFENINDLAKLLFSKNFQKNVIKFNDWNTCIQEYIKIIKNL